MVALESSRRDVLKVATTWDIYKELNQIGEVK